MESRTARYHREELAIALTPCDKRHLQPTLPERVGTILDLGCGAGQTLIACNLGRAVAAYGVDIDAEALALGRELAPGIRFVRARGERLPFADNVFDVVISRVALPYMAMPTVLTEVARVLKTGGYVWFALHTFAMQRDRLRASLRAGHLKDVLYSLYILGNGLLFHCTGRQVPFPLNRRRYESFQTVAGMTRTLRARRLDVVSATAKPFLAMTAIKRL